VFIEQMTRDEAYEARASLLKSTAGLLEILTYFRILVEDGNTSKLLAEIERYRTILLDRDE
jgi:hypothetical protein